MPACRFRSCSALAACPRPALTGLRAVVSGAAVRAVLLAVVLGAGLLPAGARAQKQPPALLSEEAALALPAAARAVAINADESMLAAATEEGSGRWRVHLFDRPSRGELGSIIAKVGASPRIEFSPAADLLLIAGDAAVELWNLPLAPLSPGQPLPVEHRRWAVALDAPPAAAHFGSPPDQVVWAVGGALFRRSVQSGTAFDGKPVWEAPADAGAIAALAFDPGAARAAVVYRDGKSVDLLDLNAARVVRSLRGHRFAVVAARFMPGRPLLTLDAGNNLLQWQRESRPVGTTFLERVPEGFQAAGFTALGDRYLLLLGRDGRALAIEERTARPVGEVRADGPGDVAASPTGRYVLAAQGQTLHLYGFARPLSPLAYVRRLRGLQAYELAQTYVRLMDDHGISPQLKADLLAEAGREPPGLELSNALTRLQEAEQEGDTDRIRYWAEQVLNLQPGHPDAVAALRRLRELADAQTLRQAREAYNAGQNRVAISLLSDQVREDSRHYSEALALIRQAEARRALEAALQQAREKLDRGDYVAAQALVHDVLRKDADNPAAGALLDEIDERSGASRQRLVAMAVGLALAVLLVGLVALRFRRRLAPMARKLRLDDEQPPSGPLGRGRPRPAEARAAREARPPPRERTAPRTQPAQAARRKVMEGLIAEAEQRLQQLRQADVLGRLRARLMELEAELSAIQRRAADPTVELGALHSRLKAILGQVRGLRIERPQPPPRDAAQERADTGGAPTDNGEPTHYEVLRLAPDASQDEIRAAYHRLLKEYHPDLHTASQFAWVKAESERMSRRIAEAYEVLGDAGARARYDRTLRKQGRTPR